MNRELMDFMMSISVDEYQDFIAKTMIKTKFDIYQNQGLDEYTWIDIIEQYLPFLKNAVDNPYHDVIEVSDEQSYENRFLVTLTLRLNNFLHGQYQDLLNRISAPGRRQIGYFGKTILEGEEVEIKFEIKSTKKGNIEKNKAYGLTIKDRIKRMIDFLETILKTPFLKSLKDISLVKSPIQKTSAILEELNYRKLLEMWEFLESYILLQKTCVSKELHEKQREKSKRDLYIPYFMNYQVLKNVGTINSLDETFYKKYVEHLIERLVEEGSMDEKLFKKMVNKKFDEEYAKKRNRDKTIQVIYEKSIDNYQKQTKDALRALRQ